MHAAHDATTTLTHCQSITRASLVGGRESTAVHAFVCSLQLILSDLDRSSPRAPPHDLDAELAPVVSGIPSHPSEVFDAPMSMTVPSVHCVAPASAAGELHFPAIPSVGMTSASPAHMSSTAYPLSLLQASPMGMF